MASTTGAFTYNASLSWLPQRDPRSEGWALTGSPLAVTLITVTYVYFVKIAGPRYMSSRKPFNLKSCILVYNFLAALLSAFFVCRFVKLAYLDLGYTFLQDLDLRETPANLEIVRLSWWLYVLKIFELSDTVFFVLRKKNDQASALHVVHHVVVAWNMWLEVTYGAQSHSMVIKCVNSSVHVLMYTYYFLSALGPAFARYLWWKKHMTKLQITQFAILFFHAVGMALASGNYVRLFIWLEGAEAVVFFVWFISFYTNAYTKLRA
uniref:Elongation of very long chain fatty acids protein n=1 Tax=Amblyomma triste TaxID=251400 RepID=A0A023GJQ8_AMBTT